jgi:glycerol dehydrogenase-like iron-containing ADH family enzyme
MSRKRFLRVGLPNLFKTMSSSSPLLLEGILIAGAAIPSLGKRRRASAAEHFHQAGVRQKRG